MKYTLKQYLQKIINMMIIINNFQKYSLIKNLIDFNNEHQFIHPIRDLLKKFFKRSLKQTSFKDIINNSFLKDI